MKFDSSDDELEETKLEEIDSKVQKTGFGYQDAISELCRGFVDFNLESKNSNSFDTILCLGYYNEVEDQNGILGV